MSIISGAEDVKYHTKYKELKRTVKDIEAVGTAIHVYHTIPHFLPQENDRIHYKVLQAKRNIQRMKLERASVFTFKSSFFIFFLN
jgi:hypothetical protein